MQTHLAYKSSPFHAELMEWKNMNSNILKSKGNFYLGEKSHLLGGKRKHCLEGMRQIMVNNDANKSDVGLLRESE